MQAQTTVPAPHVDVEGASDTVELSGFELIFSMITLLVLTAFITSIFKWIGLLYRGTRFFGDRALLPARPRPRPYWNPALFIFFFGVLIVASMLFNEWATQAGWTVMPAKPVAGEIVEDLTLTAPPIADPTASDLLDPVTVVPNPSVSDAVDPGVGESAAIADNSGAEVGSSAAVPAISVVQLLLSSAAMLAATIVTLVLAQMFRPQLPSRENLDGAVPRERPRIGCLPSRGDISLGLRAAWLILPPTMLLMGLVSVMQKYSHPVLDALKPSGPDAAPDFTIFAALFFTTAIITPLVEEFWFRGMLQGGLQRLADMAAGPPANSAGSTARPATLLAGVTTDSIDDPSNRFDESARTASPDDADASPRRLESVAARPVSPLSWRELERDLDTRSDWTPTAVWPIVLTSVVFAVMHWGQGLAPIPLFFLSLGLGYLYRQTGSLVPPILVHFTLNGFTMCVTLLQFLR